MGPSARRRLATTTFYITAILAGKASELSSGVTDFVSKGGLVASLNTIRSDAKPCAVTAPTISASTTTAAAGTTTAAAGTTTAAAGTTTTKLRTATTIRPDMVTVMDEKRSDPDEDDDQYFVMGLSLTVTLVVVIALTSIAVICVTQCGSRANQYKSKDGAGGDEDAEVHVVSAENQEKVMSDDPYEVNIEMRTMAASEINSNKEDVAEPEHEPESEPKVEAPTAEDSQKAAHETTV